MRLDREEGFKAFFKGGPARILRSSPQFGFTLVAYEYLHKVRFIFLDSVGYEGAWADDRFLFSIYP